MEHFQNLYILHTFPELAGAVLHSQRVLLAALVLLPHRTAQPSQPAQPSEFHEALRSYVLVQRFSGLKSVLFYGKDKGLDNCLV